MKKVAYILTLFVFAALSQLTAHANTAEIFPKNLPGDSLPAKPDSVSLAKKKICSCRLMEVKTDTYETQLVAIFAEKTLKGKKAANYRVLNAYLRHEKDYFRIVFLESLKKKGTFRAPGDCQALLKEIRSKNRGLKLYNIIDVDALMDLVKK